MAGCQADEVGDERLLRVRPVLLGAEHLVEQGALVGVNGAGAIGSGRVGGVHGRRADSVSQSYAARAVNSG